MTKSDAEGGRDTTQYDVFFCYSPEDYWLRTLDFYFFFSVKKIAIAVA